MLKTFIALLFLGVLGMAENSDAYEAAYPKTPNGEIEIKGIPAAKIIVTEDSGNYFDHNNDMFMRLFRYISDNDVSMTVPVEAQVEKAQMKFYVGSSDSAKDLTGQGKVKVISLPERTVVSIGIRGSYTKKKFEANRNMLLVWLQENRGYDSAGDAYAVYWDAPFVPWFMKHSEVHIPVKNHSEKLNKKDGGT